MIATTAYTIENRRRPIAAAFMADLQRSRKIGILGGTGWPSTVHYYAEMCRHSEAFEFAADASRLPTIPEMCIESLDKPGLIPQAAAETSDSVGPLRRRFEFSQMSRLRHPAVADLPRFTAVTLGVSALSNCVLERGGAIHHFPIQQRHEALHVLNL